MKAGPSTRSRSAHRRYLDYLATKDPSCNFCAFSADDSQVLASHRHFWLVKNIFPYDIWDDNQVLDHLMIVPKRHIVGLGELTAAESKELFQIIGLYEGDGYSLYARAPQNIAKSIVHQHTHLIKLGPTRKKFKLYIRKPHILITR